jgi:transcription initiation factor TFIIIB Brf1 subunit/transcription initiation factor TFIIB
MSDAISLGVRAFEDIRCLMGRPPGCVFEGGMIEHDSVTGEATCALCGAVAPISVLESSPDRTATGEFVGKVPLSQSGAKRGREEARRNLFGGTKWDKAMLVSQSVEGLVNELDLSANGSAEAARVFKQMLDLGFHKGGTGLDAVVHASAYFGARYDYNFIPLEKIVGTDPTSRKKARRVVKRARKEKVVENVTPTPEETLDSHLKRHPHSSGAQEMARKYARLVIPGLRPGVHASGALYMALRDFGEGREKLTTQADVGDEFRVTRKSVGLGYRAIQKAGVKTNPSRKKELGLTALQVKLLRQLR